MSFKTFITLTTDASFYKEQKVGGYAFWISCSAGKYHLYGAFKNNVQNPTEAEMKCIINGVAKIHELKIKADILQINTDCLNAIHLFTDCEKEIKKYNLEKFMSLKTMFYKCLKDTKIKKVQFKHIKSHEHTLTARNWVNEWCDRMAKEGARKAIEMKKSKEP